MALPSRILVCGLMVVFDSVVADYDKSADLRKPPSASWLRAFERWDTVNFVDIAESSGYRFDQFYAFCPGYPLLVRIAASLTGALSTSRPLLGEAVLVANISFVVAVVLFFKLTLYVLSRPTVDHGDTAAKFSVDGCQRLALLASAVFCFNPASVFCSVPYSESSFTAFSFGGMYLWMISQNRGDWTCSLSTRSIGSSLSLLLAALRFAAGSSVRSNGVTLCGFFLFSL